MVVLNLSTQIGLNLTRHSQQATADEVGDDPMDYMMGLDLAVNSQGFEASLGKIIVLFCFSFITIRIRRTIKYEEILK